MAEARSGPCIPLAGYWGGEGRMVKKGGNERIDAPAGGQSIKDVHTEGKGAMSKLDKRGHWGAGI